MKITDSLRKWANLNLVKFSYPDGFHYPNWKEDFDTLVNEIDETFDRTCAQHEAVLQDTIDKLAESQGFADRVCDAVVAGEDVTLFGVDYSPSTDPCIVGIETYNHTIKQMLGEAKHLHDVMLDRLHSSDNRGLREELRKVRAERDELKSQLRKIKDAIDGDA